MLLILKFDKLVELKAVHECNDLIVLSSTGIGNVPLTIK